MPIPFSLGKVANISVLYRSNRGLICEAQAARAYGKRWWFLGALWHPIALRLRSSLFAPAQAGSSPLLRCVSTLCSNEEYGVTGTGLRLIHVDEIVCCSWEIQSQGDNKRQNVNAGHNHIKLREGLRSVI